MRNTRKETKIGVAAKLLVAAVLCGTVDCLAAGDPIVYDFSDIYGPYLTTTETVIWQNRKLSEITSITAMLKGGWISQEKAALSVIYDRTDTSFTAQLQCLDGSSKAVRAYFRQEGADIVVSADKSGYGDAELYGTRMPDELFFREISTDGANGVYGAKCLEAFGDVRQTVQELPESESGIEVRGGILQIEAASDQEIASAVSGSGGLKFLSRTHGLVRQDGVVDGYATKQEKLVLVGGDLSTMTLAGGTIQGGWCGGPFDVSAYNVVYDPAAGTLSAQFQYYNPGNNSLKGVAVVFTAKQDGSIVVRAVKAAQAAPKGGKTGEQALGSDMFGEDWPASGTSIATSDGGDGYGVKDIRYSCDVHIVTTLSGEKAWMGGTMVDGANVIIANSQLAKGTDVRIVNGGRLTLAASGAWDMVNGNSYLVSEGAVLADEAAFAITDGDRIVLDAGTFEVGHLNNYVNDLVMMNGATIRGGIPVRAGLNGSAIWKISGTGAMRVLSKTELAGSARTLKLDTDSDIVFEEEVFELPGYEGMKFAKTGPAKATFRKSFTTGGEMTLDGGTVEFGDDASFGSLVLTGDAAVKVSEGHTLAFGDSSAVSWSEGVTLEVSGRVRFGTSSAALTRRQLRQISINGNRVHLDADGWLEEGGVGLQIIFR